MLLKRVGGRGRRPSAMWGGWHANSAEVSPYVCDPLLPVPLFQCKPQLRFERSPALNSGRGVQVVKGSRAIHHLTEEDIGCSIHEVMRHSSSTRQR